MRRLANGTQTASLPAPAAITGTPGYGIAGNIGLGIPGSIFDADIYNTFQEELFAFLTDAGISPDNTGADLAQVVKSIRRLYGGNSTTLSANTTLTADHAGMVLMSASGGNRTLTLPAANAVGGRPLRLTIARTDTTTANSLTLTAAGSDTLNGLASGTLPVGATVTLVSDGVNAWRLASSTGLLLIDTFTANGTATAPWWARRVDGIVTGAGGGAARSDPSGGNFLSSGGGGAAGTAIGTFPVTPGQTFAITAPAGGAGGSAIANAAGTNGGTASFGSLMSATGGSGTFWSTAQNCAGGAPGVGSGGQINLTGGYGGDGMLTTAILSGFGGASYWGGGGRAGAGGGFSAGACGAGGGGNYAATGSGGAGGNSIVVAKWLP